MLNGEDGNDLLIGGAGDDRLVGGDDRRDGSEPDDDILVGTDYASADVGEIDYFRGGAGADTFVLGELRSTVAKTPHREGEVVNQNLRQKIYYADNDITSTGVGDYAYSHP